MNLKIVFVLLMLFSGVSNAAIVDTFLGETGRNEFLALPGTDFATGLIPNLGNVGSSETIGTVTLTNANGLDISVGPDNRSIVNPGNDIVLSGLSDLNLTFAEPVLGFGFDIVDTNDSGQLACNATCLDSEFEISLFNGGMQVGTTQTFNPTFVAMGDDILDFFGVTTNMLFNIVQIRETVGSAENEIFGQIYSSVPIPAPLVLFASALLVLLPFRRRERTT